MKEEKQGLVFASAIVMLTDAVGEDFAFVPILLLVWSHNHFLSLELDAQI
jgi:hypothetical protein